MEQHLVSIILTSYNQPELLERAFNSLLQQLYKNIEIIIVDDCSTNKGNRQLIEQWKQQFPDRVTAFYQTKNIGIPANKNTGFRLAKGEFISYLDGDDTYYENKIGTEMNAFKNNPDVDIVYSNFDIKKFNGEVLSIWSATQRPEGYIFRDIILHKFPDSHTHRYELFKRNVLHDLNFYDECFSVYHDFEFMLRYSLKYKVAYNDYVGSSYYKNPESIVSRTKGLQLIEQQEEIHAKYNEVVKQNNLEQPFKAYLKKMQMDKLFYLEKPDYAKLFRCFLNDPTQLIKLLRIANYLHKVKAS